MVFFAALNKSSLDRKFVAFLVTKTGSYTPHFALGLRVRFWRLITAVAVTLRRANYFVHTLDRKAAPQQDSNLGCRDSRLGCRSRSAASDAWANRTPTPQQHRFESYWEPYPLLCIVDSIQGGPLRCRSAASASQCSSAIQIRSLFVPCVRPPPSPEDLCETHQTLHSVYGHGTCGLVAMMSAPHAEGRTFDLVQA